MTMDKIKITIDVYGTKYTCDSFDSHVIFSVGDYDYDGKSLQEQIEFMSMKLSEYFIHNKSAIIVVAEGLTKVGD